MTNLLMCCLGCWKLVVILTKLTQSALIDVHSSLNSMTRYICKHCLDMFLYETNPSLRVIHPSVHPSHSSILPFSHSFFHPFNVV